MYNNIPNNGLTVEKTANGLLYVVKNKLYVPEKKIIIAHSVDSTITFSETNKGGFKL